MIKKIEEIFFQTKLLSRLWHTVCRNFAIISARRFSQNNDFAKQATRKVYWELNSL